MSCIMSGSRINQYKAFFSQMSILIGRSQEGFKILSQSFCIYVVVLSILGSIRSHGGKCDIRLRDIKLSCMNVSKI
jgi:hypothetical protein